MPLAGWLPSHRRLLPRSPCRLLAPRGRAARAESKHVARCQHIWLSMHGLLAPLRRHTAHLPSLRRRRLRPPGLPRRWMEQRQWQSCFLHDRRSMSVCVVSLQSSPAPPLPVRRPLPQCPSGVLVEAAAAHLAVVAAYQPTRPAAAAAAMCSRQQMAAILAQPAAGRAVVGSAPHCS